MNVLIKHESSYTERESEIWKLNEKIKVLKASMDAGVPDNKDIEEVCRTIRELRHRHVAVIRQDKRKGSIAESEISGLYDRMGKYMYTAVSTLPYVYMYCSEYITIRIHVLQ